MLAIIEFTDVFSKVGSTNTGMALDIHVVAQGQNDFLDLHGQLAGWRQAQHLSFAYCGVNGLE